MLEVTRALNAEKPSRLRQDLNSIRISTRQWNHFSARSASKPTHNFQICVVISECTPIAVCKSSVISAVKALVQLHRCRSTNDSVTQPELSQAVNLNNNSHSKFRQQWQRHQIHIWCFAITRHSSHQDFHRFLAFREFSRRAPLKHHTFLYSFPSTTSKCHLWISLTERHRLN